MQDILRPEFLSDLESNAVQLNDWKKKHNGRTPSQSLRHSILEHVGCPIHALLRYSAGILSYQAAAILDLKRGWTGIQIAKKANDHCCATLCNNDKRYDSVKIYLTSVFPGISRNENARHL